MMLRTDQLVQIEFLEYFQKVQFIYLVPFFQLQLQLNSDRKFINRYQILLQILGHIIIQMPFKKKLIKEMQKCIDNYQQSTLNQQNCFSDQKYLFIKKDKKKGQISKEGKIFRGRIRNIYQLFLRKMPAKSIHVMLPINQEALLCQEFQQSYFRTTFYLKSIKKVQLMPNCLLMHLAQSDFSFTPIQYSIQRFKSFGKQKFYRLACQMQDLIIKFKTIYADKQQRKQQNDDKFYDHVCSLGNRMFVLRTSTKFALSRSFLELLEYDPEEYCIQVVKYRSSLYEGCTTKNYFQIISKSLQNINNLIDLLFGRISLQSFLNSSILRLKDVLYTKTNKKIYANVKAGMPNPYATIYEVEQVLNISDQLYTKNYFQGEKRVHLKTLKSQFRNTEIKTIKNLMELPPSYLPENEHLVTNYIQKVTEIRETQ